MTNEPEPVQLTCTSSQREQWENAAKSDSLTFADWIRFQLDDAADEEADQGKWTKKNTLSVVAMVLFILASLIATPFFVSWVLSSKASFSCLEFGEFGDMFGATNAMFSGVAFLGVVYAIILQKKELEAQRAELRLTRKEFKKQNKISGEQHKTMESQNNTAREQHKAMEMQNKTSLEQYKTMELQRFENTFFHLLDALKRELDNLTHPGSLHTGYQCFIIVKNKLTNTRSFLDITSPKDACGPFKVMATDTVDLNQFFSMVENILKFLVEKKEIAGRVHFDALDAVFNKESRFLMFYKTRLSPGWNDIDPALVNKLTKDRLSKTDFPSPKHYDWPIWNEEEQA